MEVLQRRPDLLVLSRDVCGPTRCFDRDLYPHLDVCLLVEKLESRRLGSMPDPSGASGRIHACATEAETDDALSKLATAATRARKALDAYQADGIDDAYYYLNLLFGGQFPAR